ncbi:MAG: hypothetical protein KDD61_11325, partial [Bdellovibrionales bacterium]|nr:hypothetical protein [Bdellovibrionales bacterium]
MKGNFKLYIIILAVAMGLFFQFLKNTNWNLSPQQHEEISTSNIKGMDTKAFAISKEEREKTTAQATFRNKQVALNKKMMEQLKKQLGTKNTKVSKLEFGKKKGVKGQGKKKKDKKKTDKKKSDKEKKKVGTVPEGTGSSDVTLEEEAFEQEEVDDAIPYVSSDVSPTTPESLRDKEKK